MQFNMIFWCFQCSRDDIWSKLRHENDNRAVHIANPKTLEFQVGVI